MKSFPSGPCLLPGTRLKAPHGDRRVILYCHGGGYTSGNLGYSRVLSSKLAHVTGYDVLSFEYRLAPEHPYPAAVEDAMRAWDYLMYQGYGAENVTVAGDSAGGNLALVLCRCLKAAGRRDAPGPAADVPLDGYDHVRGILPGTGGERPHADTGVHRDRPEGIRRGQGSP